MKQKLNGNNLNYIYNLRKFKLFPIVSVLLSSICVCCSYFPMQEIATFANLLYYNYLLIFVFHFCPPFVPVISKDVLGGQFFHSLINA